MPIHQMLLAVLLHADCDCSVGDSGDWGDSYQVLTRCSCTCRKDPGRWSLRPSDSQSIKKPINVMIA